MAKVNFIASDSQLPVKQDVGGRLRGEDLCPPCCPHTRTGRWWRDNDWHEGFRSVPASWWMQVWGYLCVSELTVVIIIRSQNPKCQGQDGSNSDVEFSQKQAFLTIPHFSKYYSGPFLKKILFLILWNLTRVSTHFLRSVIKFNAF